MYVIHTLRNQEKETTNGRRLGSREKKNEIINSPDPY
jgi:hypothetical protein